MRRRGIGDKKRENERKWEKKMISKKGGMEKEGAGWQGGEREERVG